MRDHRRLEAFRLADRLADEVYALCGRLPGSERYRLASQMGRSSLSVPANIVEGHGRDSSRDCLRFLPIAFGSLRELGCYLERCEREGHFDTTSLEPTVELHKRTCAALGHLIRHRNRG